MTDETPMPTMLEQMARAAYERHLPAPQAERGDEIPMMEVPIWENASKAVKRWTLEAVAAAIRAVREPTHMMLVRGSDQLGKPPKDLPTIWRDMIDELLKDAPQ